MLNGIAATTPICLWKMRHALRGLTLTQPWATLIAIGENSIETRSWGTSFRGEIVIQSAKGFPRDARELCTASPYREVLAAAAYLEADDLPRGEIIAVADLVDVMRFARSSHREIQAAAKRGEFPRHEADFGDFSSGRYGWVLKNVRQLENPVPFKGMLGLWKVPPRVELMVRKELRP